MAQTSWGFNGTINELQWAKMGALIGEPYCVEAATALAITQVAGQRTVRVAAGVAFGAGVATQLDAAENVALPAPAAGQWFLLVLRRVWASKTTSLVAIPGGTTSSVAPTDSPVVFPAAMLTGPGVQDDQPLAWLWANNGGTAVSIFDLRRFPEPKSNAAVPSLRAPDTALRFTSIDQMKLWTAARGAEPGQRARVGADPGEWEFTGTLWIPTFNVAGRYSYRANVDTGGAEFSFGNITPTLQAALSNDAITEVLTAALGGWVAKFDMELSLDANAYSAIGGTRQSLNNRTFWRSKRNGTSYQMHGISDPYETDGVAVSVRIGLRAGELLSFNAYQNLGTTITMVLDPTITYLGPMNTP